MAESSLPENHPDNSVPFSSENYDQANVQQPEKQCSTSSSDCFEDNEIIFAESYSESGSHSSSYLRGNPEDAENVEIDDHDALEVKIKNAVLCAIFESLDLLHETKGSLKNFEELLTMARHMYCKGAGLEEDDETVKKKWPSDWTAVKQILTAEGYEDAKEYFICLSDMHPQHLDILESQSDLCRHCGEKGTICYYYLGLKGKIKRWVSHPDMCYKLLSHWREKEHWLNRNEGWHTKKELWDGDRFAELSWFWDPNMEWCLPVRCQYPGCGNIISAQAVMSAEVAYLFRSAYPPLRNESAGGTLYRTGDDIIGLQGNQEICLKIIKFYLVEHDNVFTPFAICDAYQYILNDESRPLRHQLSDTIYVRPFQTCTCIGLSDIVRPIMLWLEPDGKCAVVDHSRKTIPLPKVIVPVYPQPGDMVSVRGDQDEIWHAEVRQVDHENKRVKEYFFVKHLHWRDNQLWVRESSSRAMDIISYKSIIDILPGIWQGPNWQEQVRQ